MITNLTQTHTPFCEGTSEKERNWVTAGLLWGMCQQCSAGGMHLRMSQLEPTPRRSFPLPSRAEMLKHTSLRKKANFQLPAFPLTRGGWRLRAQSWAWRSYTALNQGINTRNCLYLWKSCRHIHTPAKSICTWQAPHRRSYSRICFVSLAETGQRRAVLCLISVLARKQHNPDCCMCLLKGRMHLCLHLFSIQMKEK